MSLSDYESTLKSYIYDEDKLVTYKWLSKELEMHVNVAKDILKQFWEKYQSNGDIVATHLLIGQLKDGSIRVEVVLQSNLKAAKDKFTKVDCEHLYSLQKCLPDIELLALAGDGDLRYSAIKCDEQFIRDDDEIDDLRYIGNVSKNHNRLDSFTKTTNKVPEKQASKQTDIFHNKKVEKSEIKKDDFKEKEENKTQESKSEVKPATAKKISPPSKTVSGKANDKAGKKPLQSKQSGFNNLFAKAASKPVTTESKKVSDNIKKEKSTTNKISNDIEIIEEKGKVQEKENSKNNHDKDNKGKSEDKLKSTSKSDVKVDNKAKNKKSTSMANNKKRQRSQEKNTNSKRKRIVVIDSSDEESEKGHSEVEEEPMEVEEEPPKPIRKRSPSPPAEKKENGKRMVRKTIDKTFKDEDGYLVTKRVHVYEVAEEDDEPKIELVQEPPKSKQVDSKAKKQTTLMSFLIKS